MKKWILPALMLLLVISCTQKKLDTQEAYQLLKESKQFPRPLNVYIATADPNMVSRLINSDLEKSGFISIKEAMSLGDMGSTQILFNEKSNPYLIPASEDEKKRGIQKVRIADEDIASVTEVKFSDDEKKAIAEYTLTFKNMTPFSSISPADLKSEKRDTANFELKGGKWILIK